MARKNDRKLLAAPANGTIGLTLVLDQKCPERLQNLIADIMAQLVIDRLEVIKVQQYHAGIVAFGTGIVQRRFQHGDAGPSIQQTGQFISRGQFGQPGFQFLPLGHIH